MVIGAERALQSSLLTATVYIPVAKFEKTPVACANPIGLLALSNKV